MFPENSFVLKFPEEQLSFYGDPARLRQMLDKLIENAVDFTQAEDSITLEFGMKNGKAFELYTDGVRRTVEDAVEVPALAEYAAQLDQAIEKLESVTLHLISVAQSKGPEAYLADATLYLEFFGIITIAWQWLKQAVAANNALEKSLSRLFISIAINRRISEKILLSPVLVISKLPALSFETRWPSINPP